MKKLRSSGKPVGIPAEISESWTGIAWHRARDVIDELLGLTEKPEAFLDRLPHVLDELGRQAEAVIQPLADALQGSDAKRRSFAAFMILAIAAKRADLVKDRALVASAAAILIASLGEGSVDDRLWPCLLLSELNPPLKAAETRLRALMSHADERLRVCAAAALSTIDAGNQALVRTLRDALRSSYPALVMVSAKAFARLRLHSVELVRELVSALAKADAMGQYPILLALGNLGHKALPALDAVTDYMKDPLHTPALRRHAATMLGRMTKGTGKGTTALMRSLQSHSPALVEGAIAGLIEAGDISLEAIDRFLALLSSPHEGVRIAALSGLGAAGPHSAAAVSAVLGCVDGASSPQLVEAVVSALGSIGTPAAPALLAGIRSRELVRETIGVAAFLRMGGKGAELLAEAVRTESDEYVRLALVAVIRDLGMAASPAVPMLESILNTTDDEELAACVVVALDSIGPAARTALPGLLRCVVHGSDELAALAERVIWNLGPDAAPEVEASLAKATGAARARLTRVLSGMRSDDYERFRRFEEIGDDKLVWTFVYVAELMIKHERMGSPKLGYRKMEALLRQQQSEGTIPPEFTVDDRTLSLRIARLKERHNFPVLDCTPKRKGTLLDGARGLLPDAKAYLNSKARRHQAHQSD